MAQPQNQWANWRRNASTRRVSMQPFALETITRCKDADRIRQDSQTPQFDWMDKQVKAQQKDTFSDCQGETYRNRTYDEAHKLWQEKGIHCEEDKLNVNIGGGRVSAPYPVASLRGDDAGFPDYIMSSFKQRSWKNPTPIQMQAWPSIRKGHDVVALAPTGSGKTMAYVLPMLCHVRLQEGLSPGDGPIALVLVPTRELAEQVAREVRSFASEEQLVCRTVTGGVQEKVNVDELKMAVEVVIATPGRLLHFIKGKHMNLFRATFWVIDEADELLNPHCDFLKQVKSIMEDLRPDRQIVLFSATCQDCVQDFARDFCKVAPLFISVGNTTLAACRDITQCVVVKGTAQWEESKSKTQLLIDTLRSLVRKEIENDDVVKVLIFCNKADSTTAVAESIQKASPAITLKDDVSLKCEAFSSDKPESREKLLRDFKDLQSSLNVLVATSVLGRGHDFPDLKFVINFDMPESKSAVIEYIHRIGRTGRAGRKGFALTLLDKPDLRHAIELKKVMEASDQMVPDALAEAATKKKVRAAWDLYNATQQQRGPDQSRDWWGRGSNMNLQRNRFLEECGGGGAARLPRPDNM